MTDIEWVKIAKVMSEVDELGNDTESQHIAADALLCSVIERKLGARGKELVQWFRRLPRWYS